MPTAVRSELRRLNADNLPDSAQIQTGTATVVPGTTTRTTAWNTVATHPCRCVPFSPETRVPAQAEQPIDRFEISFRVGVTVGENQRLVITLADGRVKTLTIDSVLSGWTDDTRTVVYGKEV